MAELSASLGQPVISAAGHYLHWGVVQISLTNFLIILGMIAVFVLALVVPFPGSHSDASEQEHRDDRH